MTKLDMQEGLQVTCFEEPESECERECGNCALTTVAQFIPSGECWDEQVDPNRVFCLQRSAVVDDDHEACDDYEPLTVEVIEDVMDQTMGRG